MQQTNALIKTMKRCLRSHGLTYRDVAKELSLSETSIKRIFAEQHISLARMEQVCQMMGMQITDLVKQMERERSRIAELSLEQELEVVADTRLLLVAFLVMNHWQYHEILDFYDFSEPELIQYLVKLDRLEFIELLPNNRFKLVIAPRFAWRKNGPIQQFFDQHLHQDFFQGRFDERGEVFRFLSGMLSTQANEQLITKLRQVAEEFYELNQAEMHLPLDERFGYSMVLAMRPWRPNVFEQFRSSKMI